MPINVTGRQFTVTPAIQDYAVKLFTPFAENATLKTASVNVVMERVKNSFSASVVVNCKLHTLKAETSDFDLYKALDAAAVKLDSQAAELKGKIQDHRATPMGEVGTTEPEK